MAADKTSPRQPRHVFIIGAKSIGQYGGYETFVDRLVGQHEGDPRVRYHVACKANGEGAMDESRLDGARVTKRNADGSAAEFEYRGAHAFKIPCPDIGPAVAIHYDLAALRYALAWCEEHRVERPVFYVLTCRIGPFMAHYAKRIHALGGTYLVNPDGHEWARAKWPAPVRAYWRASERRMVRAADLVVCDSVNIERYIASEYAAYAPRTTYIAYGADVREGPLAADGPRYASWLADHDLSEGGYYLVVGRLVPENNFEAMVREFMASDTRRSLALVTNPNDRLLADLEKTLHVSADPRIKFVGSVYDRDLLGHIREGAWAYLHGHEVGGTNPSLLEALASTDVNLLLDVGFNREVGAEAVLYWIKEPGDLASLIDRADAMPAPERQALGQRARARIREAYSWDLIGRKYMDLWDRW